MHLKEYMEKSIWIGELTVSSRIAKRRRGSWGIESIMEMSKRLNQTIKHVSRIPLMLVFCPKLDASFYDV